MADRYDYYGDNRDNRGDRDRDAYLDNRTGVGAQGRGYPAPTGGQNMGPGQRYTEGRSFRPDRDYDQDRGYRSYPEDYQGSHRNYGGSADPYRENYAQGAWPSFGPGFGFANDLTGAYSANPSYSYGPYEAPYQYQSGQAPRAPMPHPEHHRGFWDRAGDAIASWMGDDEARRRHMSDVRAHNHQGKGPKGYKRSDTRIHEDVNDRLTEDPWLDATHIEVQVQDTEVTLTGLVRSRDDRHHAERIAEHVTGVTYVQNNLRVNADFGYGKPAGPVETSPLDEQARGKH